MTLFSIGYATKTLEEFLKQLGHFGIDGIADIRTVPYSNAFHDYTREPLQRILKANELHHVYLGKELRPHLSDPRDYDETRQTQLDRPRLRESKRPRLTGSN